MYQTSNISTTSINFVNNETTALIDPKTPELLEWERYHKKILRGNCCWIFCAILFSPLIVVFVLPLIALYIIICFPCHIYGIFKQEPKKGINCCIKIFSYCGKVSVGILPIIFLRIWEPWIELGKCVFPRKKGVRRKSETVSYYDRVLKRECKVKCYIYEPNEKNSNPLIPGTPFNVFVYYYGGGFIMGSPLAYDMFFKKLVARSGYTVCAPCYRKAPEFKITSILREQYVVLKWLVQKKYASKDIRLIVSGDSAGGRATLLMSHYFRDKNYSLLPKRDLLFIPVYPLVVSKSFMEQNHEIEFESRKKYGDNGYVVPITYFTEEIVPLVEEDDPLNGEYNNYNLTQNLNNLPATFLVTAEFCCLKSEGIFYMKKLTEHQLEQWKEDKNNREKDKEDAILYEHCDVSGEVHGFVSNHCVVTAHVNTSIQYLISKILEVVGRKFPKPSQEIIDAIVTEIIIEE